MIRRPAILAALIAMLALPAPAIAGSKPQRIVSMNLCTDQLLLQMVPRARIRSVSYLASDTRSSAMVEEARGIAQNRGVAEQVIAMKPDLVLAGSFTTSATVGILRRLGYRVVTFDPDYDFDGVKANIAKLGEAVGEPDRAEAMIAEIDTALAALPPPPARRPVYADYGADGWVSGKGTLVSAVARAAGFVTLGETLGYSGTRQVPLEQMLVTRPDVVDLGSDFGAPALATEKFRHPALRHVLAQGSTIGVPAKYTACGTLKTLEALRAFADARKALP